MYQHAPESPWPYSRSPPPCSHSTQWSDCWCCSDRSHESWGRGERRRRLGREWKMEGDWLARKGRWRGNRCPQQTCQGGRHVLRCLSAADMSRRQTCHESFNAPSKFEGALRSRHVKEADMKDKNSMGWRRGATRPFIDKEHEGWK